MIRKFLPMENFKCKAALHWKEKEQDIQDTFTKLTTG